jgi:hypothetical protein
MALITIAIIRLVDRGRWVVITVVLTVDRIYSLEAIDLVTEIELMTVMALSDSIGTLSLTKTFSNGAKPTSTLDLPSYSNGLSRSSTKNSKYTNKVNSNVETVKFSLNCSAPINNRARIELPKNSHSSTPTQLTCRGAPCGYPQIHAFTSSYILVQDVRSISYEGDRSSQRSSNSASLVCLT